MARVSLLQLDTDFLRVPGDVGCRDTFCEPLEIIRIPNATVDQIVTDQPSQIDLSPFLDAIVAAEGDIIATSCGFLAPFQSQLQAVTDRPVIASALDQLVDIADFFNADEVGILTFDAGKLGKNHLPASAVDFANRIYGLAANSHLRDVISNDRRDLDITLATQDVQSALRPCLDQPIKALVLECTNLPPYKAAIRQMLDVPIFDILSAIEKLAPNTIQPEFL